MKGRDNSFYTTGQFGGDSVAIYNADGSYAKTLWKTTTTLGQCNGYIIKYNNNGSVVWTVQMGGTSSLANSGSNYIVADSEHNLYITGQFNDILNIYNSYGVLSYTLTNSNPKYPDNCTNIFVVKYDKNGNFIWATKMGGKEPDFFDCALGIHIDISDNIYVCGWFNQLKFDIYDSSNKIVKSLNNTTNAFGANNGILVKYNEYGNFVWSTQIGGTQNSNDIISNSISCAVVSDTNNNVYVTGNFNGDLNIYDAFNFKRNSLNTDNINNYYDFLIKYDEYGNFIWATKMGVCQTADNMVANAIINYMDIDTFNNIYVTGYFNDLTFKIFDTSDNLSKELTNTTGTFGPFNMFLIKYSPDGECLWATKMGGPNNSYDISNGVEVDLNNNIYISGNFNDITFNIFNSDNIIGKTLTNPNTHIVANSDTSGPINNNIGVIIKYNIDGECLWATKLGGKINSNNGFISTTFDKYNNVYAIGYFTDENVDIYNSSNNVSKTLTNTTNTNGQNNTVVVKYDKNGQVLWVNKMGGPQVISNVSATNLDYGYDLVYPRPIKRSLIDKLLSSDNLEKGIQILEKILPLVLHLKPLNK